MTFTSAASIFDRKYGQMFLFSPYSFNLSTVANLGTSDGTSTGTLIRFSPAWQTHSPLAWGTC